ncbi:23S rRNA (uracil(1939)-C(5))-methyltransferase RlmD [Alteromonas sp. H39]|uniref:23S rRNA (uracil(1939)-C(5))-methyltransferase RlmD n=1 Tax=Alteromonas sp. H39 TaxID=3389876 RepID=UPI0039E0359A
MVSFYKPGKSGKAGTNRHTSNQHVKSQDRGGQPAQSRSVTIDSWDWQGLGVSRQHPVTFVDGALPGETCDVRIVKQQKNVAYATAIKVTEPSALRRTPFCPIADKCGGCQLQHVHADEALALREQALDSLWKKQLGLNDIPWQPALTGNHPAYRRKARLAVDARDSNAVRIGFRERRGKQVVDVESCPVLVTALNDLLPELRDVLMGHEGIRHVGHVSLLRGDNCSQVTVKITRPISQTMRDALTAFGEKLKVNVQLEGKDGNFQMLHDEAPVTCETEPGLYIAPQANDFVQVNREVNQQMISQAMAWLEPKPEERIADWFSGLGNFSLSLARRGAHVQAVEGVSEMVQRARANARKQGVENIDWLHLDLTKPHVIKQALSTGFDKVLLDPSREGALEVCEALAGSRTKKILYVSCNPSTWTRDAKVLLDSGYKMDKVGVLEMFPYTRHLEVMALFTQ